MALRSWFKSSTSREENSDPFNDPPTLDIPWRTLKWEEKDRILEYVQEYKPANEDVDYLRVLLYGPVRAGKSSFINSVSSVLRGRITIPASASATLNEEKSYTTKYETHKINRGRGETKTFYPVVFNDVMGLEEGANRGVHADDIKLALKGHVKEAHKFNKEAPLTEADQGYNPNPGANDKVHVLACVISANSPQIKSQVLDKMKSVREAARDLGIPQIMIMTHIDEACGEVEKSVRNVYTSNYVKKKMKDFSAAVGIPMNCIFPVKNYCDENDMDDDIDFLVLSALQKIIDFGDDYIEKI